MTQLQTYISNALANFEIIGNALGQLLGVLGNIFGIIINIATLLPLELNVITIAGITLMFTITIIKLVRKVW